MKKLRIGVVMDPIENIDYEGDTTFAILLEAQERGHEVWCAGLGDLYLEGPKLFLRVAPLSLRPDPDDYYSLGERELKNSGDLDLILMRKDPPFDTEYVFATYILDHSEAPVVNHPSGIREAQEKLYALRFPEISPETIVTRDMERLQAFVGEVGGKAIVKPLDGCGGAGIFLLAEGDRNTRAILETRTDFGRRFVTAQRYLPEVREGDKRILLLDGEPIGAVLRVPRPHESRANIHVGGRCVKTTLTGRDRFLVGRVAEALRREGLLFVGLDVIGDYVTEINVTSPTGLRETNALDGARLERLVVDKLEVVAEASG